MKTFIVNLPESIFSELEAVSKSTGRSISELILEALQLSRRERPHPVGDLSNFRPRSVGAVLQSLTSDDDLLDEMLPPAQ